MAVKKKKKMEKPKKTQIQKLRAEVKKLRETSLFPAAFQKDAGWRSLVSTKRDVPPFQYERHLTIADYLFRENLLAKRIIETKVDHVLGKGIKVVAKDEKIQEIIDTFWDDPDNDFGETQFGRVIELLVMGELLLKAFVNDKNGDVKLGFIDNANIEKIENDKENASKIVGVKIKNIEKSLVPIRLVRDGTQYQYEGDCFLFQIHKLSTLNRGYSDLLTLFNYIGDYDDEVNNLIDRSYAARCFIWSVTLDGATQLICDKRRDELEKKPPKPGSFHVHNQREKWDAVTPKIQAGEQIEQLNHLLSLILGGAGIPFHWFTQAKGSKAGTIESSIPTLKGLTRFQAFIRRMFRKMINFAIDQKVKYNPSGLKDYKRGGKGNRSFEVVMPDITVRDLGVYSDVLKTVTNSLTLATENGWLTQPEAEGIFKMALTRLGYEVEGVKKGQSPTDEKKEWEKKGLSMESYMTRDYKNARKSK